MLSKMYKSAAWLEKWGWKEYALIDLIVDLFLYIRLIEMRPLLKRVIEEKDWVKKRMVSLIMFM